MTPGQAAYEAMMGRYDPGQLAEADLECWNALSDSQKQGTWISHKWEDQSDELRADWESAAQAAIKAHRENIGMPFPFDDRIQFRPEWTSTTPKDCGWYFHADSARHGNMVFVNGGRIWNEDNKPIRCDEVGGLWAGPITPPTGTRCSFIAFAVSRTRNLSPSGSSDDRD